MLNQLQQKQCDTAGYVYVLSNPYIPNLIKICGTSDIYHRISDQGNTGRPTSFVMEFYVYVDDCQALETELNNEFTSEQVQGKCNFYDLSVQRVIAAIKSLQPDTDIFSC